MTFKPLFTGVSQRKPEHGAQKPDQIMIRLFGYMLAGWIEYAVVGLYCFCVFQHFSVLLDVKRMFFAAIHHVYSIYFLLVGT